MAVYGNDVRISFVGIDFGHDCVADAAFLSPGCVGFFNSFPVASVSIQVDVRNCFADGAVILYQYTVAQTKIRKLNFIRVLAVTLAFPRIILTALCAVFGYCVTVVTGITKQFAGRFPIMRVRCGAVGIVENLFAIYDVNDCFGYINFATVLNGRGFLFFGSTAVLAFVNVIAVNVFNELPPAVIVSGSARYGFTNSAVRFSCGTTAHTKSAKVCFGGCRSVIILRTRALVTALSAGFGAFVAILAGGAKQLIGALLE